MPINEIEKHPFLDYYTQLKYDENHFTGLIVGTFPIYSITNSIIENSENYIERFNQQEARMKFFYGSKKSYLWKYVSAALNENNPTDFIGTENQDLNNIKQRVIDLLYKNKLLITDTLSKTNRRGTSSSDNDLYIKNDNNVFISKNMSLNYNIINILTENKNIKNIFFTSTQLDEKSPFGWFTQIFEQAIINKRNNFIGNRCWSLECTIWNKQYNLFFLPTPKTRGIHFTPEQKVQMFVNYIQSIDLEFFNEIINLRNYNSLQRNRLSALRNSFLIECYKQAIVKNNIDFNGSI